MDERAKQRLIALALGIVLLCCGAAFPTAAQNRPSAAPPSHAGLEEEFGFLHVRGPRGPYRLEAVIARPAQAAGRLPVALITHGKQRSGADMALMRAATLAPLARDLAHRGFLAVGVIRRGFGRSDGTPGRADNAAYVRCSVGDLTQYFAVESEQIEAALRAIVERPDADPSRLFAMGGSVGGGAVIALASRPTSGLVAALSIAAGVRLTNEAGQVVCPPDTLINAIGGFGANGRTPMLWLYAENDSVFAPALARRVHHAYVEKGGRADLQIMPALRQDGHHLMELPDGRIHWLAALDPFLRQRRLPTWTAAQVDAAMRAGGLRAQSRKTVEAYFSAYTPKALIIGQNGFVTWTASTREIDKSRHQALETCRQRTGTGCRVLMQNFELLSSPR